MDLNALVTMFVMMGHSVAAGAGVVVLFVATVAYMRYSASKDRTRTGYGRL